MNATSICAVLAWCLLLCPGCETSSVPPLQTVAEASADPVWFVDVTDAAGIRFRHAIGELDQFELPQIMGSGAGWLDYDSDGWQDLYLIGFASPNSLYRQLPIGQFRDGTTHSRLAGIDGGMGLAVGDFDDDGFSDLVMTAVGGVRLWRNQGDGTFTDITSAAGLSTLRGFATAAGFFDLDQDGSLDLLIVNYVDYVPGQWCEDGAGRRDFCGPTAFRSSIDRLFRNQRKFDDESLFLDVTIPSGFAASPGRGLGAVFGDFDGDRRPDVYVANDLQSNFLWIQQADGTFQELGLSHGVALNQLGEAEASMGIVAADLDNDGALELFLTHLSGQTNTLYDPRGGGHFVDQTPASGLGPPSLPFTGFGVAAADFNHDGDLDLVVANGRVKRDSPLSSTAVDDALRDYAEPNQLFLGDGDGHFREAGLEGGEFCSRIETSRSIASADIDDDGDVDFVLTNCSGPARLYVNESDKLGGSLIVRLIGTTANRDAIGADVTVRIANRTLLRRVAPSCGYLASHDRRLHFGLGTNSSVSAIEVAWPDGSREEFAGIKANRSIVLQQGQGSRWPESD